MHCRLPRCAHPDYEKLGGVPATAEIKFSLISNRGCFGGCSFCALTFHQGRIVQTRSHESLLQEAKEITQDPDFKGYIHDVGGPTANFRHPSCEKQLTKGVCKTKQCLFPTPCKNLNADHKDYVALLRKLRKVPRVKKVFIRSGNFVSTICWRTQMIRFLERIMRVSCQRTVKGGTGTRFRSGSFYDGKTGQQCV